ncbi:MAG TPA: hypothetical protein VF796_05175 [Humisphaera sp.]
MSRLHTHNIRVETPEERVTVQIGGEGSVPGGFAKLFNRVVDSEAWANLSDAARAAYIPLVRFADHRNQFRIQIGQASLMKYSGLSRSSIKRAVKDLLASRLIVLVEQGGVTADGRNESNLYQLMVPTDPKPRLVGGRMDHPSAEVIHSDEPPVGPDADPLPAPVRTPSPFAAEPRVVPPANPAPARDWTATPSRWTQGGGVSSGPQLRSISELKDNSRLPAAPPSTPQPVVVRPPAGPIAPAADAAVLLEENGVDASTARQLAAAFPMARIVDVVETMQFRRARGKCENPGGFIREALVKQWQTPRAVVEARAKAEARARAEAVTHQVRRQESTQAADVDAEQRQIDQLIGALDDDELELLAREVLKKYDGNPAVLGVLTRKPPRDCRLMKMEVANLLGRR